MTTDQVAELIAWAQGNQPLVQHILNGVARGLYSAHVANPVLDFISTRSHELLKDAKAAV